MKILLEHSLAEKGYLLIIDEETKKLKIVSKVQINEKPILFLY
jgi:hypothetical protein